MAETHSTTTCANVLPTMTLTGTDGMTPPETVTVITTNNQGESIMEFFDEDMQRELEEYDESGEFFENMDQDEIEDWYEDGAD